MSTFLPFRIIKKKTKKIVTLNHALYSCLHVTEYLSLLLLRHEHMKYFHLCCLNRLLERIRLKILRMILI